MVASTKDHLEENQKVVQIIKDNLNVSRNRVGSISTNPGSTSTRPTKNQGNIPIGFNIVSTTYEASDVSL